MQIIDKHVERLVEVMQLQAVEKPVERLFETIQIQDQQVYGLAFRADLRGELRCDYRCARGHMFSGGTLDHTRVRACDEDAGGTLDQTKRTRDHTRIDLVSCCMLVTTDCRMQ